MITEKEFKDQLLVKKRNENRRKNKWIAQIEKQFGKKLVCPICDSDNELSINDCRVLFVKRIYCYCSNHTFNNRISFYFQKIFGKWKFIAKEIW